MVQYVIIGNGVAGVRAAEIIRRYDSSGSMVMISEERYPFYYRPSLPEYVAGLITEERLWARPKDFYTQHKIELQLDQKVAKVLPAEKLVCLEDGENISYDNLLIATGGSPAPFHCPGWDAEGVVHLKTLADAKKLREKVQDASAGVVIGTGILGLELIDTFIKCGLVTHYLLAGDNIWPAVLDEEASAVVENSLSKRGVSLYKRAKIRHIGSENNKVKEVLLTTGEAISCQLVGVAIGLRPNIEMVRWSGVQLRGMISVNRRMETSIPRIFMVSIEADYEEIPICAASTTIAGINLLCLGNPLPPEGAVKILSGTDRDKGVYKKIVLRDGQIEGALFIGDVRGGAKVAQLMQQGPAITPSEQAAIQELVMVDGAGAAMAICPICKMEISPAGCPACGQ